MNDEFGAGLGCGILIAILACLSSIIGCVYTHVPMRDAIEHGAAYYHPETGEFTWKDEVEEQCQK